MSSWSFIEIFELPKISCLEKIIKIGLTELFVTFFDSNFLMLTSSPSNLVAFDFLDEQASQ